MPQRRHNGYVCELTCTISWHTVIDDKSVVFLYEYHPDGHFRYFKILVLSLVINNYIGYVSRDLHWRNITSTTSKHACTWKKHHQISLLDGVAVLGIHSKMVRYLEPITNTSTTVRRLTDAHISNSKDSDRRQLDIDLVLMRRIDV